MAASTAAQGILPTTARDDDNDDGSIVSAHTPWWRFWGKSGIRLGDDDHLPSFISDVDWKQVALYGVLILLGAGIGSVITGHIVRRGPPRHSSPLVPGWDVLPPPTGLPRNNAYLIKATHGAVASEDKTCSELGVKILQDHNGTAVDAAVTTSLCIGLLNAFSSGIGGGGFMVVRVPQDAPLPGDKDKEAGVWAIDFRETSPAKSHKWMYADASSGGMAAKVGGLAVGVPGELRGLEAAHKLYGRLPWADIVMPVAELAHGWQVSRELARRLRLFGEFMLDSPAWSAIYTRYGQLLVEGDYVQRINYGKTLEKIAKHGADVFYHGDIAASSVKTVQAEGGVLTLDDLKGFEAITYPAIHQTYHNKTIYTTSAPSSGGIMLGLMNILELYNIPQSGGCLDALNTHRLVEATKFAFGARSQITDPKFADNASRFDDFYSKEWARDMRAKLTDNSTHGIEYYGLLHDTPVDHGTTHLSVVDQWGGAASVTSTINLIWGSRVMDPDTGIIFNDEQDDFGEPNAPNAFGLLPSPWNYPAPGKKPLSSIASSILVNQDGSLYAVLGGSGGSRIFPAIAQVILNLDCGLDISQAIEKPRIHNQIMPLATTIEVGPEGSNPALVDDLEARGHEVEEFDINLGLAEVQGIVIENGTIWAASDSRKNGVAAGY